MEVKKVKKEKKTHQVGQLKETATPNKQLSLQRGLESPARGEPMKWWCRMNEN